MVGSIGTAGQLGLPQRVDVAVVDSGAAGLVAALSAALEGSAVLVVESEPLVGGTTAISGGAAWVPNHGLAYRELTPPAMPAVPRRGLLWRRRLHDWSGLDVRSHRGPSCCLSVLEMS